MFYNLLFTLPLNCTSAIAGEVTQCFEKAWGNPGDGGLGLNRGQAIELCQGASNADEVVQCFEHAWGNPDDGGLGLNRGGAIELCRPSVR